MDSYLLETLRRHGWTRVYQIFLRDHVVNARIGVHAFEKVAPQRVRVEARVFLEERPGEMADHIDEVVDYDFLRSAITDVLAAGHLELQETLVSRVLARCMARPEVLAAVVSSSKLDVYPDCEVGCTMHRVREPG